MVFYRVMCVYLVVFLSIGGFVCTATAQVVQGDQRPTHEREQVIGCLAKAAVQADLPPEWLLAIALQESGLNSKAINTNANGSTDVGLMQINSSHSRRFSHFGVSAQALLNPCINALVGAMILREQVNQYGLNAIAIGRYHSATPQVALRYAQQVCARLQAVRPC